MKHLNLFLLLVFGLFSEIAVAQCPNGLSVDVSGGVLTCATPNLSISAMVSGGTPP